MGGTLVIRARDAARYHPGMPVRRWETLIRSVAGKARPRRRPDVSGLFSVVLVCAIASGVVLGCDLLRERVGIDHSLVFAAKHPMAYVLGACMALLGGLLAVGDV
jgi:hypothetical protein